MDQLSDPSKSNWKMYWGGNIDGITKKLPYILSLGINSILISPILENTVYAAGSGHTGYHGYWTRDFKRIDPHFGDWSSLKELVVKAHAMGINVFIDFVPNHTNPLDAKDPLFAEGGALYDDGIYMGNYFDDNEKGFFHHNGIIDNWDQRFRAQWGNFPELTSDLPGICLADLSQENPVIADYLIEAAIRLVECDVDGFRIDSIRHVTYGFGKMFTQRLLSIKPLFIFGEWYGDLPDQSNHLEKVRFANSTGIALLDFDLSFMIREVFGFLTKDMSDLAGIIESTQKEYLHPNDLITFIDNQDVSRFCSINSNPIYFHQALAFILTCRGIPSIYYGTEQYMAGGENPFNRAMMSASR